MQILGFLVLVSHIARRSSIPRAEAFSHPAFIWMLVFLLFQTLSVHGTGVWGMVDELGFWIAYLQFVALSLLLVTDERTLVRYVWGMICGSMFVVGYGIYAVIANLPSAVGGRAGAYGMYENHNDYSFLIVQVLPFIYMCLRREASFMRRWFLRAAFVACIVGIFLSLSRGGVLALVLELILIVWLTLEKRRRWVMLPTIVLLGAVAIGYQWIERAENQGDSYTAEDAEASRMELWRAAGSMIRDRPLLGVGSRTFGEHSREYAEISRDNRGKNSHNTYLEILATSGVLGFLAFVMMLRWLVRDARRRTATTDWLQAIRTAATISFYAIAFRALLDAKAHDWSFYFLLVVAITSTLLARRQEAGLAAADTPLTPWGAKYSNSPELLTPPIQR
ncbi:MAG: O-antigen ligase family protein [Vicinamibacterales bacterium]